MNQHMFLSRLVAVGQVDTGISPPPDTARAAEAIRGEEILDTGEPNSSSSISSSLVKAGQPGSGSSSNMVKAGQPGSSSINSNNNMVNDSHLGSSSSSSSNGTMVKAGQPGDNNMVRTGEVAVWGRTTASRRRIGESRILHPTATANHGHRYDMLAL